MPNNICVDVSTKNKTVTISSSGSCMSLAELLGSVDSLLNLGEKKIESFSQFRVIFKNL